MRSTASSSASRCEYCGEPLKVIAVEVFGEQREVPCFGSCGCRKSAEVNASYGVVRKPSTPTRHRCPKCGGQMVLDGATGYVSDCPWCGHSAVFGSDLEAYREGRRVDAAMEHGGILYGTGVPRLYWDVEPDHARAERIEQTGKGFYIVGHANGTYKTLTAAAIAKAMAERGRSVRYVSSTMMMEDFKASFGTERSEAELIRELAACDLLIIDDMGKEQPTSWAATVMYTVIDTRYGSMKPPPPIVVTTNFDEHELVTKMATASDESTATATMSRIWEMTEKLVMDGPDRRLA